MWTVESTVHMNENYIMFFLDAPASLDFTLVNECQYDNLSPCHPLFLLSYYRVVLNILSACQCVSLRILKLASLFL